MSHAKPTTCNGVYYGVIVELSASIALESSVMIRTTASIILFAALGGAAFAQPEVMAWGNLTGFRVDGHLLEMATSMCVAQPEMAGVSCTGREKQQNSYSRNGKVETVKIQMRAPREFRDALGAGWSMNATEAVEDTGPAAGRIDLEFTSPEDANIGGAFLGLELPASVFSGGSVQLVEPDPATAAQTSLAAGAAEQNEYVRAMAKGARFISRARQIEVTFGEPTLVIVRDDRRKGSYNLQVLFAVLMGKTTAGQTGKKSFAFKVTGEIDKNPVEITLDASHPGQLFDGLGGNFRLQNARTDPQVIDYSLDNIRWRGDAWRCRGASGSPRKTAIRWRRHGRATSIRGWHRRWRWPGGWRRRACR